MSVAFWLRNVVGTPARVHLASTDCVYCPVCAEKLDCTNQDLRMFLSGGLNTCRSCNTHLGNHDVPNLDEDDGIYDQAEEWEKLRHAWLERNNWDEKLVQRVRDQLETDVHKDSGAKSQSSTVAVWFRNQYVVPARIHLISSDCVCCPVCAEGLDCSDSDSDLRMFLFGGEVVCPSCRTHLGGGDVPNLKE